MGKIQRYDTVMPNGGVPQAVPTHDGYWVKANDALPRIAELLELNRKLVTARDMVLAQLAEEVRDGQ